ncbi:MAG: Hsp20/alpha crystallin family protein [Cytophagaceae bacterium]|nr:Hsp20/alpha crystallin family protein [Cytophagaceae bacterium]
MATLVKNTDLKNFLPRTYNDLFESFFKEPFLGAHKENYLPSVDIAENETHYFLHLSLAGVRKEDVKIELEDGKIIISGEKKLQREENGKKYHKIESHYGSFTRSFYLPDNVNVQQIEANFTDGVLDIKLPKAEIKTNKTSIEIR